MPEDPRAFFCVVPFAVEKGFGVGQKMHEDVEDARRFSLDAKALLLGPKCFDQIKSHTEPLLLFSMFDYNADKRKSQRDFGKKSENTRENVNEERKI